MVRTKLVSVALLSCGIAAGPSLAQAPAAPPAEQPAPASPPPAPAQAPPTPAAHTAPAAPLFAPTKVEGTEGAYVFRYQNHQSRFVVTPAGVIATDPISYGRPQAAVTYVAEIKKITDKPIKYLIYSHHHYDHIAGGKPFQGRGRRDHRA